MADNVSFSMQTSVFALIGYPLEHSLSSIVYNEVFRMLKKDALYIPFEIKPEELGDFIKAAKLLNLKGFGLTMPHKSAIIPYLDYIDETARIYNCVNAVIIRDGKMHGYCYDGKGYATGLRKEGVSAAGRDVLFLGTGSVTGVIAAELAKEKPSSFTFLNRTVKKAEDLAKTVSEHTGIKCEAGALNNDNMDKFALNTTLLIQTTSLGLTGMKQDYDYLDFIDKLPQNAVVTDLIYNPKETSLLKKARERGLKTVNGLRMVYCQSKQIIEKFFPGEDISEELVDEAGKIIKY
ncbi:MAG: shikimate dehydrogenase [Eubacteriales bacterium]